MNIKNFYSRNIKKFILDNKDMNLIFANYYFCDIFYIFYKLFNMKND